MLTVLARSVILYAVLVLTVRGMGKRQMGQLQPYELVITMLIANLVSAPISDMSVPILQGVLPLAALFVIHGSLTLLCMRSDRARAFLSGKPSLIIENGVLRQDEMKRLCLTLSDVLEGLRACGLLDPAEVGTAVMEANGAITAFPRASCRPPKSSEMGVTPCAETLPMVLVMDGRRQENNLVSAGRDAAWLDRTLKTFNLTVDTVFLCSLDGQMRLFVQDMGGALHYGTVS